MNYNEFILKTLDKRKSEVNIDKMRFLLGKQLEITEEYEKEKMIRSFVSTEHTDRVNDIIRSSGVTTEEYRKNPVVLSDHNTSLVIGKNLELSVQQTKDGVYGIMALTQFAPTVMGAERFWLHKEGFLNAWSVGVACLEWEIKEDDGWDIKKSNLFEYSSVPIPCNPYALDIEKFLKMDNISNKTKMEVIKNYSTEKFLEVLENKQNEQEEVLRKELDELKNEMVKIKSLLIKSSEVGNAGASLTKEEINSIVKKVFK